MTCTIRSRLWQVAFVVFVLAAPVDLSGEQRGGGFTVSAVVVPAGQGAVSSGGWFELVGGIRQTPLRVYGGDFSLGISEGVDTTRGASCACLCWGSGEIFADDFGGGDTSAWSLTVP